MELRELFIPGHNRITNQEVIPEEVIQKHIAAIEDVYKQAGLDPSDTNERKCPGIKSGPNTFQVNLSRTPSGELIGIHSLARTQDEEYINETDMFMWINQVEATSGRLKTPDYQYLVDYSLDVTTVQRLTDFIKEATVDGQFTAVDELRRLSVPQ